MKICYLILALSAFISGCVTLEHTSLRIAPESVPNNQLGTLWSPYIGIMAVNNENLEGKYVEAVHLTEGSHTIEMWATVDFGVNHNAGTQHTYYKTLFDLPVKAGKTYHCEVVAKAKNITPYCYQAPDGFRYTKYSEFKMSDSPTKIWNQEFDTIKSQGVRVNVSNVRLKKN